MDVHRAARAFVEGRLFHRGSVVELVPDDIRPEVGARLLTLARRQFVRPDRAQVPDDDGYRFAHIPAAITPSACCATGATSESALWVNPR